MFVIYPVIKLIADGKRKNYNRLLFYFIRKKETTRATKLKSYSGHFPTILYLKIRVEFKGKRAEKRAERRYL